MLREEQDPTVGSRCLPSRGPDAAISRGADGQVTLRAEMCGPDWRLTLPRLLAARWTTRHACRPRLIPREGTTPVAEDAFSTARKSVGPTRPTPPRLECSWLSPSVLAASPNQLDFND